MLKHFNIKVSGRVQGVFFRVSTQKKAKLLGIMGWVKNQPDGSVYIEAEGTETQLAQFLAWCAEGPLNAVVSSLEKNRGTLQNFKSFRIL